VEVAPPGRVLGVDIPVGVGRVAGSIRVEGAPASLSRVGVAAMGPIWPVAWEDVAVAGTGGSRVGTFHMFGLDDGEYPMFAVPDLDGDGDFGNDMQRGRAFPGEPDRVVIANGGNATCDFSFSLGAP
jgi:hypothetical protein